MRGSNFIFDSVNLLPYKCHQKNLKRGGSYMILLLDKKAAINLVNGDDKCFQYVVTIALDYEEIGEKFRKSIKN